MTTIPQQDDRAREAFLDLIADALVWEENPDEDAIYYKLEFTDGSLVPLINALGIEQKAVPLPDVEGLDPMQGRESPADAIDRAMSETAAFADQERPSPGVDDGLRSALEWISSQFPVGASVMHVSLGTVKAMAERARDALAATPVAVPVGMKPWPADDSQPDDWDREGKVLLRDGRVLSARKCYGDPDGIAKGWHRTDIAAYAPVAVGDDVREQIARIIEPDAWGRKSGAKGWEARAAQFQSRALKKADAIFALVNRSGTTVGGDCAWRQFDGRPEPRKFLCAYKVRGDQAYTVSEAIWNDERGCPTSVNGFLIYDSAEQWRPMPQFALANVSDASEGVK